jgi:hypothetical protein
MTFREQRKATIEQVHFNEDQFAEPCIYIPPNGGPQVPLTAIVQPATEAYEMKASEDLSIEMINVRIMTDPTSVRGGVAQPQIGAALVRTEEQGDRYSLSDILGRTGCTWRLRFQRERTIQVGNAHTRR